MKDNSWIIYLITFVVIIGIVLGIRLAWAELVYHDKRCVFAECRIQK